MDEGLNCRRKEGNISDPHAVAVIKFGNIICKVTGPQHYSSDLPRDRLEVPCRLAFRGDSKLV